MCTKYDFLSAHRWPGFIIIIMMIKIEKKLKKFKFSICNKSFYHQSMKRVNFILKLIKIIFFFIIILRQKFLLRNVSCDLFDVCFFTLAQIVYTPVVSSLFLLGHSKANFVRLHLHITKNNFVHISALECINK